MKQELEHFSYDNRIVSYFLKEAPDAAVVKKAVDSTMSGGRS